jgi:hypothetical protein
MGNCTLKAFIIGALCVQACLSSCDKADTKKAGVSSAPPGAAQNTTPVPGGAHSAIEGLPVRSEDPPRIVKLKLLPVSPRKGDELVVQAVADGKGEGSVEFLYQWSVNDSLINTERGPTLKNVFAKGDRVSVVVTPEAAGVSGIPSTHTVVIGNSPPVVKSELVDVKVQGNSYSCRVQAEDPDGDPLVYTLLKGPAGMTIDRNTGVITGVYQQADTGMHTLSISVKDTGNAEVVLTAPLKLGSVGKGNEGVEK